MDFGYSSWLSNVKWEAEKYMGNVDKASELVDVLGVRETRTKALLRALVEDGVLVDNGVIKGRKYKKRC